MKWIDLPPVWLFGFMAAMWALAAVLPWPGAEALWLGRALIGAALLVMVWTAVAFRRRRTSIIPHMQPDALVTEGPLRFSRNPIYASDVAILIGWGLSLGAAAGFVLVPAFVWILRTRFIEPEEARLAAAFGPAFADYCARTRRWI